MATKARRERDPIGAAARMAGTTRLEALRRLRAALLERHPAEAAANPRAMANLDEMILALENEARERAWKN